MGGRGISDRSTSSCRTESSTVTGGARKPWDSYGLTSTLGRTGVAPGPAGFGFVLLAEASDDLLFPLDNFLLVVVVVLVFFFCCCCCFGLALVGNGVDDVIGPFLAFFLRGLLLLVEELPGREKKENFGELL